MSKFEEIEKLWKRHANIRYSSRREGIRSAIRRTGVNLSCSFAITHDIATINGCIILVRPL